MHNTKGFEYLKSYFLCKCIETVKLRPVQRVLCTTISIPNNETACSQQPNNACYKGAVHHTEKAGDFAGCRPYRNRSYHHPSHQPASRQVQVPIHIDRERSREKEVERRKKEKLNVRKSNAGSQSPCVVCTLPTFARLTN